MFHAEVPLENTNKRENCGCSRARQMSKHGLTIVELMLIVAIVASAAMMIVPLFESASPGFSIENESSRMVWEIRKVRQEAIDNNREYKIYFIQGTDTMEISYIDKDGVEKKSRFVTLNGFIDLVGTTFTYDTLSFDFLGEPSEGGEVELCGTRGERIYVRVAPRTGKVSLEKIDR